MEVKVGLVFLAANIHNRRNSYVLLKEDVEGFVLPQATLPEDKDSISVVREIIRDCTGITSRFIELTPRQTGVFDDPQRNPSKREILIAYSIFVGALTDPKPTYKWIPLDSLELINSHLDTEHIIRYTIGIGEPKSKW